MSTRDDVLFSLRAAGGEGISGQRLAQQLSVTRAAVAKHVQALRESGYVIDARSGTGYLLRSAPDLPIPSEVAPLVRDPLWVRIEGAVETTSTNDDARALARGGAPEGVAVVAARQTCGRGRLGREWESPVGGAYLSMILRPQVAPAEASVLPLVVAVGVARALESVGMSVRLKWPNDVLSAEGKLAGILLEMSAEADCVEWVVAGVGVNVTRPACPPPGAAYLDDRQAPLRAAVAASVLDEVASAYRQWREEGFERLRIQYEQRHALSGLEVTVRDLAGRVRGQGTVGGIDIEGRLVLRSSSGNVALSSGDVTLRSSG